MQDRERHLKGAFRETAGDTADVRADVPSRGLAGVRRLIAERFEEPLTLADLAAAARMPTNTLTRRCNRVYGTSPMRFLWAFRTLLASEMIRAFPQGTLTDVAVRCGFGSSAHFSRRFRALLGERPSELRARVRLAACGNASRIREAMRAGGLEPPPQLIARTFAHLDCRGNGG